MLESVSVAIGEIVADLREGLRRWRWALGCRRRLGSRRTTLVLFGGEILAAVVRGPAATGTNQDHRVRALDIGRALW